MPTAVLPVSVKIAREALLGQASLTPVVAARIHWALPELPVWPLIVLDHIDAVEDGPGAQLARVQANCWGAGNTTADLQACLVLANTVMAVHRDLIGVWPSGTIANASAGTVISAPDQQTGRVRALVDLLLTIYP